MYIVHVTYAGVSRNHHRVNVHNHLSGYTTPNVWEFCTIYHSYIYIYIPNKNDRLIVTMIRLASLNILLATPSNLI